MELVSTDRVWTRGQHGPRDSTAQTEVSSALGDLKYFTFKTSQTSLT